MSALLSNPLILSAAFMAGLAGSLHCVGMCGGLVTASSKTKTDIALYQIGRLMGYLLLGFIMGSIGSIFKLNTLHPALNYLPAFFIGLMFIVWGFASLSGKSMHLPLPSLVRKIYQKSWIRVVNFKSSPIKSFLTGFITLFLPCGLLYGIILSSLALQNPFLSMSSMLAFWMGTLPSMTLAPTMVQKILHPLRSHRPKVYAISLMLLGVITIGWRASKIEHFVSPIKIEEKKSCH